MDCVIYINFLLWNAQSRIQKLYFKICNPKYDFF